MKSKNKVSKFLFLIILCVSLLTYTSIQTQAIDVSDSEFIMPTDTLALQRIELTVWAKGSSGDVLGASVNISCEQGTFELSANVWAIDTTDGNGEVSFWWIAPDTPTEVSPIDVLITADISSSPDSQIINQNITVNPIDFSTSSIDINPDTVYELHNTSIAVYANSSIYPYAVQGATVDLTCDEGHFTDSGTATTSLVTNAWGWVLTYWEANLSIVISNPIVVNITAFISYTGKIVNTTLVDTITVNPMDFDSSTLVLSDYEVGGSYPVTVTTRALGSYGAVSDAEIFVDALDGTFPSGDPNITSFTDFNGYYIVEWTAPEVVSDTNITITVEIRFPTTTLLKILNATVLVKSFMHNFTSITVNAVPSTVTAGDTTDITVTVLNEISLAVPFANITLVAPAGIFLGSSSDSITVQTDNAGSAVVTWDTTSTAPPIGGFDYLIDITAIKEFYITNSSSVSIHVDPLTVKLDTDSLADPIEITQGDEVTITVHVTVGILDIDGATVQIVAQSGVFASSSSEMASLNTDSNGVVTFTWITEDMVVSTERDFDFEITASLPGYTTSDTEIISVHVNPSATQPTTPPGGGLTQSQMIGVLLGSVGGLLALGTIGYLLIRKKPVS